MKRVNSGVIAGMVYVVLALCGGAAPADGQSLLAAGAQPVKLAETFTFTEGPAVNQAGDVYFSDIMPEKIFKWSAADGKISLYREKSGQANGLAFDTKGNLIACEMSNNRLTRDDFKGNVVSIAESYQGAKLHMPNDVWVAPSGGIYFSDFAGMGAAVLPGETMQLYYIPPGSQGPTDIKRATSDMSSPNGLVGTPDGKRLYAVDGAAVYTYDIGVDGVLSNRQLFVQARADGMAVDEQGNLYMADDGVAIYSPTGKLLETIKVTERASNVKFAGADRKTLFITARTAVYTLRMNVRGAPTALEQASSKSRK